MITINYIKTYVITLVVFVLIDAVWLGFIAKDLYSKELGFLISKSPKWLAAVLFYLIFVAGLCYFAVIPAISNESIKIAIINGILLGFVSYATYDLTNLATIDNWPIKVTIIDLIWGSFLGGTVSIISYKLLDFISK